MVDRLYTGALLAAARGAGHSGRLCGLDPAAAMLAQPRRHADIAETRNPAIVTIARAR